MDNCYVFVYINYGIDRSGCEDVFGYMYSIIVVVLYRL